MWLDQECVNGVTLVIASPPPLLYGVANKLLPFKVNVSDNFLFVHMLDSDPVDTNCSGQKTNSSHQDSVVLKCVETAQLLGIFFAQQPQSHPQKDTM